MLKEKRFFITAAATVLFCTPALAPVGHVFADSSSLQQRISVLSSQQQTAHINGVYHVDQLVKFNGKWYVVDNGIAIPPIDYNNYIPVGPLTVTDKNGNVLSNQTLYKGSYFTFGKTEFSVINLTSNTVALSIGGEPVSFNRNAFGNRFVLSDQVPAAKFKVGDKVKISDKATSETNGYDLTPHRNWKGTIKSVTQYKHSNSNWEYCVEYPNGQQNVHVPEQDIILDSESPTIDLAKIKQAGINGFNSGGWSYPSGQCTSFVAGILASQGVNTSKFNYLGNGADWAGNARSRGIKVDMTPSVGAVVSFKGVPPYYIAPYGHVAFITKVNSNGTFHVYEGNWSGTSFHERDVALDNAVAGIIHF